MALTDNLISYYKLNETSGNAADSHGANTLINTNTVTYVAGKINNAANFVRTSSQKLAITDASQTGLDMTGSFSLSCWVNFPSQPAGDTSLGIINKETSAANDGYCIEYNNGGGTDYKLRFRSATGGWNHVVTLSLDTWYHVVAVMDSVGTPTLYLNGSSVATGTYTAPTGNAADFSLGFTTSGTNYFNGKIDEAGIWSRALTSSEVTSLYNGGAGLAYPFATNYPITAVQGSFALNGQIAVFRLARLMSAIQGSFALNGQSVFLRLGKAMIAAVGSFLLTGQDIVFSTYRRFTKEELPTNSFTKETLPTNSFTKEVLQSNTFTKEPLDHP